MQISVLREYTILQDIELAKLDRETDYLTLFHCLLFTTYFLTIVITCIDTLD